MAGHSKWANIKYRKERADAKRGKIYSRIAKEIISAVKLHGSDPKGNTRLRLAIQKAREANVPNDVIERNIKKAASADQADYMEITYELYGYGGVGLIVAGMTDNKNRFSSEIRIATNKRGGSIATPGSVTFNFDCKGVISIPTTQTEEESLFLAATEAGAEDFTTSGDYYVITTEPSNLYKVKEALQIAGFVPETAELDMIPKMEVECNREDQEANQALIDWLEGIDDVDVVYHNMKLSELM